MPIEIKELVIRAVAVPDGEWQNAQTSPQTALTPVQLQAMVQTCVEEVLKVLERKDTR
jgi:hypothetical protein